MPNSDKEKKEFIQELVEAVREGNRHDVDAVTHRKHHEFLDRHIEYLELKRQRYEKLRSTVTGWAAVTGLSGILWLVTKFGEHILNHMKWWNN